MRSNASDAPQSQLLIITGDKKTYRIVIVGSADLPYMDLAEWQDFKTFRGIALAEGALNVRGFIIDPHEWMVDKDELHAIATQMGIRDIIQFFQLSSPSLYNGTSKLDLETTQPLA